MLSQRIVQQSMRRLAAEQAVHLKSSRTIAPIVSHAFAQKRLTTSTSAKQNAASTADPDTSEILVKQRLHRPVSPHLSIYQPQMTWIPSIFNRITGCILSGGLYIFGALYLVAPVFGWQITSAAMAAGFAKWPVVLKVATKLGLAMPFAFHSINGLRHLVWDTARSITNQQVITTGWTVIGLSMVTSVGLLFI